MMKKLFLGIILFFCSLSAAACGTTVVPSASCVTSYSGHNAVKNEALNRGASETDADKLATKLAPMDPKACSKEEIESLETASSLSQLF